MVPSGPRLVGWVRRPSNHGAAGSEVTGRLAGRRTRPAVRIDDPTPSRGSISREFTLLLGEGRDGAASAVRSSLDAIAPLHGGRRLALPDLCVGAEFASMEGAVSTAAAMLRELPDGARLAICARTDPSLDEPLRLLRSTSFGTLTFSPDAAVRLSDEPGLSLRARELTAGPDGHGTSEQVTQELGEVGRSREVRIGGIRFTGRRRRPSGERAPLPRELRISGRLAILGVALVVVLWVTLFVFPDSVGWWQQRDQALLDRVVELRTDARTNIARAVHALGSAWTWRTFRFAILLLLIGLRRWRHLLIALLSLFVVETLVTTTSEAIGRPRPLVPIIGGWEGYAHPSAPVASLTVTLTIAAFVLFPAGRWRRLWAIAASVAVAALILARVYLGVDHLTDGVIAAVIGVTVPLVAFRTLAPERVFPVTYRRGRGAHLDIDARRDAAIRQAMRDQLGLEVVAIEPFGLEASGGSTPLRLTVAGDGERHLFAKLYSTSHLRADRWYKAARTILYGSLEDELRHPSVRRLVEREDYLLLTMRKAGIPCARPYGVVEITPEREYLTVTEFIDGAQEISQAEVDDQVIDEGLAVIRRLWDEGLAHRDIKPGNVLVQDGHVRIVDVAFAMVRPSPWRQAVDLANMMLILALRTSPERVYERALRYFAPEDIAEAFAATRSVTIPSESRSSLKLLARSQGLDLVRRFDELSPHRDPITIQRWSRRRIGLTLGALLVALVALPLLVQNLTGGGFL
jgi:tRNA A-37 threonylcarbamoyl transferase component Bud32/membrane-associated phospholipid phosphatase